MRRNERNPEREPWVFESERGRVLTALPVNRRAKGCDEHGDSAHLKFFKFAFKDKKL